VIDWNSLAIAIAIVCFCFFVWFCGKVTQWNTQEQIKKWEEKNGKAFGDFTEEYKK
jgi:hypothetical protein